MNDHRSPAAIVLAGGSGRRFGGPKMLARLDGISLVDRAVAVVRPLCSTVVVVVPDGVDWWGPEHPPSTVEAITVGDDSRYGSLRCGLAALASLTSTETADDPGVVVIHDVVRPFVTESQVRGVVAAVHGGADAATAAWTPPDVVKRQLPDGSLQHVGREELRVAHGPVAARIATLQRMFDELDAGGAAPVEETAGIESVGGRVVAVDGDVWSHHIVTPADLARAEGMVRSTPDARSR